MFPDCLSFMLVDEYDYGICVCVCVCVSISYTFLHVYDLQKPLRGGGSALRPYQ